MIVLGIEFVSSMVTIKEKIGAVMKKIAVMLGILILGFQVFAQVDKMAIIPFDLKGNFLEGDRAMPASLQELIREYLEKAEYYSILPSNELPPLFTDRKISVAEINDWQKRGEALKKIHGHVDYLVAGNITCDPDALQISVSAELIFAQDGRTIKSCAVAGNKRMLRPLALDLTRKLTPSKDEMITEVQERCKKAMEGKKYEYTVTLCNWGLKIGPATWQLHQLRARAYEMGGSYTRAFDDFAEVVSLRGNEATKEMQEDLKRVKGLVGKLKKDRKKLLQKISITLGRFEQEGIPLRITMLLEVGDDIAKDKKEQKKLEKIVPRVQEIQKDMVAIQQQLRKQQLVKASKESNDELAAIHSRAEKILREIVELLEAFSRDFAQQSSNYFSSAMKFYRDGKLEAALTDLDKALLLTPKASNAWYWKGITCGKLERYSEAIEYFGRALQYDKQNWEAYYNRGRTYEQLKNWDKALADYEAVVKVNPKLPEGYCAIGEMQEKLNRQGKALEFYNKAIEVDGKYAPAYYARGKCRDREEEYLKAKADFEETIKLDMELKSKVQPLLVKVNAILQKDSVIYAQKARALQEDGELKASLEYYMKSLECYRDNAEVYLERAGVHRLLSRYKEAVEDYTEAISLEQNAQSYYHRAVCYQNLKDYPKALEDLAKVLELNAFFHAAHHRRGMIYEEQKELEKAMESYKQAIQTAGNKTYYYLDLARVYQKSGKLDEARLNWQRARAIVK